MARKHNNPSSEQAKPARPPHDERLIYALYAVVIVLVVLYIIQNNIIIGMLAFVSILLTIILEFRSSIRSDGAKKTAKDLIIALVAVLIVVWVVPAVLLQSSSPINVVASCSMLPVLHRGDLVLVHGISNMSQFLTVNKIPVINVSRQAFSAMESNMSSEFNEPLAYVNENKGDIIAPYINSSIKSYSIGLYNVACIGRLEAAGESQLLGRCYVSAAEQSRNLIKYNYTAGNVTVGTSSFKIPEISSITIANTTVYENYSNPIIIYKTIPNDSFYSDYEIIHRIYAAIDVNNSYYMITKGDNNPVIDIQAGNYPASANDVVGYMFADIPYLGYPSLIIKGQLGAVQQCNQTILR
jgi:signal peptidase I